MWFLLKNLVTCLAFEVVPDAILVTSEVVGDAIILDAILVFGEFSSKGLFMYTYRGYTMSYWFLLSYLVALGAVGGYGNAALTNMFNGLSFRGVICI